MTPIFKDSWVNTLFKFQKNHNYFKFGPVYVCFRFEQKHGLTFPGNLFIIALTI